jgi:anaerobic selenocysteine-containing dehydrogenase
VETEPDSTQPEAGAARGIDRIAEPWGTRTPYASGEPWPVRIDAFLEEGISERDVDRWVQSASILHSNGDAMDIAVKDERIVGVRGRMPSRVNHGRLDPKDLFGWQVNNSPDRLQRPLVRENGELVETDWDTAMNRIVRHSRELLSEQGPSSFGFYTTGQLFLEDYYTLAVIARGHQHKPPRREHAPLHGNSRGVAQGELRLRWTARLLH